MMTRIMTLLAGVVFLSLPLGAVAGNDTVLDFRTMVGVDGPFLGANAPIRDINGGGLPWVLDEGRGELESDGELDVEVKGLIIPAEFNPFGTDTNPAPFFRAIVSCLTIDDDEVVTHKSMTDNGAEVMIGDPEDGDARIRATIELPSPCVAPIIFVTSPGGAWFATTGLSGLLED